tara:strand:+ start:117 stop:389 length:273 start_codon:yes stop_codon:yes gene_type:complete
MKIILREDQLENLINSIPDYEEDIGMTCRCQDYTLFYGCTTCENCCSDHGGINQDAIVPITGLGSVEYSYSDPAPIATSNSSSSFGYYKG